tara:strand:- start:33 stop:893 length:861 start_codon:yes stop_codon:yes gene_type:complete
MKTRKHTLLPLAALAGLAIATSSADAATTSYRNLILGDNPIVYYEFDETSGTTAENSGSLGAALNGTISGAITLNQTTFAQGGTAYNFGGGHVQALGALPNSLTEWTVEAWVNSDKNSASNIVSNDQGGWNDDVLIGLRPENGSALIPAGNFGVSQQGAPGATRDTPSAIIGPNMWHHVAVAGSTLAGTLTVYIDGTQVAQDSDLANGVTFNGADGLGTAHLAVGAAREGGALGRTFGGLLDEVAIYDSVLTPAQISAHANATIPEPGSALLLSLGGLVLLRRNRR